MATVDDKKIIFSMVGVSKIIPQNRKQILLICFLPYNLNKLLMSCMNSIEFS